MKIDLKYAIGDKVFYMEDTHDYGLIPMHGHVIKIKVDAHYSQNECATHESVGYTLAPRNNVVSEHQTAKTTEELRDIIFK